MRFRNTKKSIAVDSFVLLGKMSLIIFVAAFAFLLLLLLAAVSFGQERRPSATIIYSTPPRPPAPPAEATPKQDWHTNGVVRPPVTAPVEKYTAHSTEAKKFLSEAIEAPEGKIHVTVIGNADECARVDNDIRTDPAFEGIREKLWVQTYVPGAWAIAPPLGFKAGKPSIYVQSAKGPEDPKGGRVIYRAMDYSVGATGLAEAIRKADPNYRPDLDPGPHKPTPPSLPNPFASIDDTNMIIMVGGLLLVLLIPKKGK